MAALAREAHAAAVAAAAADLAAVEAASAEEVVFDAASSAIAPPTGTLNEFMDLDLENMDWGY